MSKIYLDRYYYKCQLDNAVIRFIYLFYALISFVGLTLISIINFNRKYKYNEFEPHELYVLATIVPMLTMTLAYMFIKLTRQELLRIEDYRYKYKNYYDLI